MNRSMLVKVVGCVFILIGLLGFVNNPLVGENGLFMANVVHNFIHLVSGILAFVLAAQGEKGAVLFGKIMAVVYGLVTVIGFVAPSLVNMLGVKVNMADNVLHLLLTAVFVYVGFFGAPKKTKA